MLYCTGNIFKSSAQTLVNPVNCEGIMGKGLAKEFKRIFPDMFIEYQKLCRNNQIRIGKLHLIEDTKNILLFPTKLGWRQSSKIEYIEKGLQTFVDNYERENITSIAFPALGCGCGNLNWEEEVKPLMVKYLIDLPIEIFIYTR